MPLTALNLNLIMENTLLAKLAMNGFAVAPTTQYRHLICKHIYAVDFSSQLRKEVLQTNRVIQEVNVRNCQFCGSTNLKKDGVKKKQKRNISRNSIAETATTISP